MEQQPRRVARAEFESWVELAVDGTRRLARARDLSEGGLGLVLEGPHPPPGARLESEFWLPGIGLPLTLQARVVWSDPRAQRLGLAFEALDAGVAEILQSAVAGRFGSG